MRMIIEENNKEGLDALLGKRVLLMTAGYFYEGKLVGVNASCVKIEDPSVVYETGKWTDDSYADIQKMNASHWYVAMGLIESFGLSKDAE